MAQASKNQAVEPDTEQGAKAPIDTEEILDDDDALDVEPDVGASDTLDDDKLEAGLDEDEDLLEGIPEEELKATVEVQLPKVTKSKARTTRKRNADAGVTMLTGDPVRMYLKEIGKVPLLTAAEEIDLAMKISDYLLCVKGDTVARFGPPEELFAGGEIDRLYEIEHGSYNLLFGSVELTRPEGAPQVFVVGGGGFGVPCYRALQKQQVPFATGVLFENDVDFQVARELSDHVYAAPAFEPAGEALCRAAEQALLRAGAVIDAGTPVAVFNRMNGRLLELAREKGLRVYRGWKGWQGKESGV